VRATPIKMHYRGVRQVGQFFEVSAKTICSSSQLWAGGNGKGIGKGGGRALTAAPGGRKLYENRIIYAVPQV